MGTFSWKKFGTDADPLLTTSCAPRFNQASSPIWTNRSPMLVERFDQKSSNRWLGTYEQTFGRLWSEFFSSFGERFAQIGGTGSLNLGSTAQPDFGQQHHQLFFSVNSKILFSAKKYISNHAHIKKCILWTCAINVFQKHF